MDSQSQPSTQHKTIIDSTYLLRKPIRMCAQTYFDRNEKLVFAYTLPMLSTFFDGTI